MPRRFGAPFYADLLLSLGIRLVILLDPALADGSIATEPADASSPAAPPATPAQAPAAALAIEEAAFTRIGLRVARLPAGPFLAALAAIDSAAAGGGGAALVCSPDDRGRAATLAAAWVAARHGLFPSPEAAAAWVGLTAGPAAAAELDLAALRAEWAIRWTDPPPPPDRRPSRPGGRHGASASESPAPRPRAVGSRSGGGSLPDLRLTLPAGRADTGGETGRVRWRAGAGAFSQSSPAMLSRAAPGGPAPRWRDEDSEARAAQAGGGPPPGGQPAAPPSARSLRRLRHCEAAASAAPPAQPPPPDPPAAAHCRPIAAARALRAEPGRAVRRGRRIRIALLACAVLGLAAVLPLLLSGSRFLPSFRPSAGAA